MGQKSCQNCIYLAEAKGERKAVFVCVNRQDFVGRLRLVEKNDLCRNFQSRPVIDRPTVEQPKNSNIRFIPLTKGKIAVVDAEDYEPRHFPYFNLGRIYERKGDWFTAMKYYEDALDVNPDYEIAKSAVLRLTAMLN